MGKGQSKRIDTEEVSGFQRGGGWGQDTRMASFLWSSLCPQRASCPASSLSLPLPPHFPFPPQQVAWPSFTSSAEGGLLLRKAHSSIPETVIGAEFIYFHGKIPKLDTVVFLFILDLDLEA